ncbi:sigma-70 family RNA polymerase sigma factor [Streptomyces sp. NPDC001815]|uniref:sigma-70 family RNA polymerase sigma factor n=1 Tax=Streptomyces sp. NPDC001815 TaxID=3154526 RepID=UPI003323A408
MTETKAARPRARADAERQAEDEELYAQLQRDGFEGARFEALRDDLWAYGWHTTRSWMKNGTIFERCAQNGIVIPHHFSEVEELQRMAEQRDDLATESVALAVSYFVEEVLMQERWKPDGGASIRTYFTRCCLHHFRDVFKTWSRKRRHHRMALSNLAVLDRPVRGVNAEERLMMRAEALRHLDGASWETRAICALIYSADMPHTKIAEKLRMTPRQVEGHLKRLRVRAVKARASESGEG